MTTKSKLSPKARAAIQKAQEEKKAQGHTLPDAAAGGEYPSKLKRVMLTLKKNLETTPMLQWEEPIMSALQSAYLLGKAESTGKEEGEDRVTESDTGAPKEETGYDFISKFAQHFGQIAEEIGVSPADLEFKWVTLKTDKGSMLVFMPTLPVELSAVLNKV